jgi:hypothetical protein
MSGRGIHLIQGAIHPVSNLEFGLKGLKMDVACAGGDGFIQYEVNKANDGSGVCFLGDDLGIELVVADLIESNLGVFSELGENVLHGGGFCSVMLRNQVTDLGGWRDHDLDLSSESEAKIFRDLGVERINEGDINGVFRMADGKRPVQSGEPAWNKVQGVRCAVEHAQIDDLGAKGLGDEREELVFGDDVVIHHHVLDRLAGGRGLLCEGIALVGIYPTRLDEHVCDLLGIHGLVNIRHRGGDDFLGCGQSCEDLANSVLSQRAHAELASPAPKLIGGCAVDDHVAHLIVDRKQFENPHAAFEALASAVFATMRLFYGAFRDLAGKDAQPLCFIHGEFAGLFAL